MFINYLFETPNCDKNNLFCYNNCFYLCYQYMNTFFNYEIIKKQWFYLLYTFSFNRTLLSCAYNYF